MMSTFIFARVGKKWGSLQTVLYWCMGEWPQRKFWIILIASGAIREGELEHSAQQVIEIMNITDFKGVTP